MDTFFCNFISLSDNDIFRKSLGRYSGCPRVLVSVLRVCFGAHFVRASHVCARRQNEPQLPLPLRLPAAEGQLVHTTHNDQSRRRILVWTTVLEHCKGTHLISKSWPPVATEYSRKTPSNLHLTWSWQTKREEK